MAEGVGLKPDNVGRPTLVLTMAARAARVRRQSAAMKTFAALHIGGDVLVACQAQVTHLLLVGTIVATRALLFVLGVRRRNLTGHQERFEGGRSGKP